MKYKNILFLGAHCDDIEFGCGGTIAKLAQNKEVNVQIRVLSDKLVRHDGTITHRRDLLEQKSAIRELGLTVENYRVEDISGGQIFPENRQKILDYLYELKEYLNPDLIFVTSREDVHQDHRTLNRAAAKAFNRCEILTYNIMNSSSNHMHPVYVCLSQQNFDAKIRALDCYESMRNKSLSLVDYFDKKIIESEARLNGLKAGVEFAETFSPIRLELF